MHSQYFQGILQLRNPSKEVEEFIEKKYLQISKKMKVRNGYDYYMKSNKFSRKLARILQEQFGGIVKESPKLFSRNRQTQKAIYRLNVLFKLLNFRIHDIIVIDNNPVKVSNVWKKISGTNILNGKKGVFKLEDKEYKIIKPMNTQVIKIHPQIEILDEDYQPVKVKNKKEVRLNEKVRVINYKGYYLI